VAENPRLFLLLLRYGGKSELYSAVIRIQGKLSPLLQLLGCGEKGKLSSAVVK
jgi:hypothetical protein